MRSFKIFALGLFLACSHVAPSTPKVTAQLGPLPPRREAPLQRHIIFSGTVDEESVGEFIQTLNRHLATNPKSIVVEINTPGGSVGAGMEMGKAIERSPVPVVCVVDGMAASMGLYILQSCDVRTMTKRSLLMGHEPAGSSRGQPQEVQQTADLLTKLSRAMAYHIVSKSKLTVDEYISKISGGKELWLTCEDAVAFAFVDFSVGSVAEILAAADGFGN